MENIDFYLLFFVAIILLSQSIFLFTNAKKNGMNHWFWGIIALIQAPVPLIFYFIVRNVRRKEEDELNDYRDY
ncbi:MULTISPECIES: sigma-Y antisigma factor component [Cytobacillus]|uniref:Sigma-Y antisigma factor component n=1 Tax=Cytobacillus stercorigallinarum TaxID=2762240 RepID=A0ABR8QPQ8_9BACI|nr:sigma-Y antisigma factor component [Cytobacillus stercorigallinarum]MBD7937524.1 sigma-Y antisigma factor component [Cytobacillus stercorigallinarum]